MTDQTEGRVGEPEPYGWVVEHQDANGKWMQGGLHDNMPEAIEEALYGEEDRTTRVLRVYRHPHPDRGEVVAEGWVSTKDVEWFPEDQSCLYVWSKEVDSGQFPVRIIRTTLAEDEG